MMFRSKSIVGLLVLSLFPVLFAGCEAKAKKPADIKWQPATLDAFQKGPGAPVVVVVTDGTESCENKVNLMLSGETLEKRLQKACCIKVNGSKKDDPVLKEVAKYYQVKDYPAYLFFKAARRIPKGELQGPSVQGAEIMRKLDDAMN